MVRSARIESREEEVKSWEERRFCGLISTATRVNGIGSGTYGNEEGVRGW